MSRISNGPGTRITDYGTTDMDCAVSQQAQAQVPTSLEALKIPQPEGEVKIFSPKIEKLVTDISQLNLLEVADLSDALKKRLNLPDTPVMTMGAFAPAGASQVSAEVR
ncbi:unnamed protein product, partial [Timema podura]|nr:unnamed protein product [Timema podura]